MVLGITRHYKRAKSFHLHETKSSQNVLLGRFIKFHLCYKQEQYNKTNIHTIFTPQLLMSSICFLLNTRCWFKNNFPTGFISAACFSLIKDAFWIDDKVWLLLTRCISSPSCWIRLNESKAKKWIISLEQERREDSESIQLGLISIPQKSPFKSITS